MLDAGSGQKALLVFSEKTSDVSTFLVSKDGVSHAIARENCPKSFEMIKTLDNFNGFLDNAQAKGVMLSDGTAKVYVEQKGLGGSGKPGKPETWPINDLAAKVPPQAAPITGLHGIGSITHIPGHGVNVGSGVGYVVPMSNSTDISAQAQRQQHLGFGGHGSSKPAYSASVGFRFKF